MLKLYIYSLGGGAMLYVKSKILLILGIVIFISMYYFKVELGDSIFRPLGYVLSGILISYSLVYKKRMNNIIHLFSSKLPFL